MSSSHTRAVASLVPAHWSITVVAVFQQTPFDFTSELIMEISAITRPGKFNGRGKKRGRSIRLLEVVVPLTVDGLFLAEVGIREIAVTFS